MLTADKMIKDLDAARKFSLLRKDLITHNSSNTDGLNTINETQEIKTYRRRKPEINLATGNKYKFS